MASPFSLFRRHQKIMLAVVGVAAMVAFVFLDPVMRYMGRPSAGGGSANDVVVETSFGNLTGNELEALRYQRQLVEQFLARVVENAVVKQFGNANIDNRWLAGAVDQQFRMWRTQIMARSVLGPEAEAVETMVLAERAKQMGLVISDRSINDLIKQLSNNNLNADELQAIIHGLQPERPISVTKLFDALRTELLASQYSQLFVQSLADIPPAQRFDYFSRLNRRVKSEVLSVAVADFIGQVADPSDAELKTFYEKYKDQFASPTSPEPGFKEPKRASFEYFKAALEPLAEKLKPEVTEEEIAKYYEENKRNFPAMSLDDPAAKPAEGATEAKPAEEKPAAEKPATETPAASEAKPAEEPAAAPAEDKPAEPASEAPAETPAAEEKPAEAPAEEKPAEEKPAEETPAESPQARVRTSPAIRLVSLQESAADEAQPATEPAAEETPATEEKPAETAPAEEKPAEEKPAAEKPADDKPAEKPAETPPAADAPKDPGDEVVKEPPVPAETPQFEPLEKVADTIRGQLARDKALKQLDEQFEELSAKMRRFDDDYVVYSTEKQTNAKAVAPTPLNFAELAKGKDVQAFELKSVTPLEASKEDIGKSFRPTQGANGAQGRSVPFVEFAYAENLPLFKPEMDQDAENNFYLFWKTSEEPAFVPPLDQVRDQVVRAWKMIKARELAKKRGQEYAQQAETLKKPLAELFGKQAGMKVIEPAPFSWLTVGNVPTQPNSLPRLSEIEGLDQAGEDFMKMVFGLQPGGAGVAFNTPQDTVFVARVIEFEPSEEQLRDEFARENPNRYMAAANEDRRAIFQNWIADLNKDANVHWVRQADVRNQQVEESEEEF